MKTAKVPPAEASSSSSSSRKQPVRQTRTNPPRANPGLNRLAGQNVISGANAVEQPIQILPATTHFADAITALPKELVRHFTLLKEVDAKIFAPEVALFQMVDQALHNPPRPPPTVEPTQPEHSKNGASISAEASSAASAQSTHNGAQPAPATLDVFDPSNLPRRQLFRQTAFRLSEMLTSLDEKNHVISTANDALQRHLGRIDDIWPHLENEYSEEAKWGSDSHWAYPENRAARALNSVAERTRREGAASLSAAAHVIDAGDAAARSDARKQAVAAKKSQKNQHLDSDRDDHENKGKEPAAKKQPAKRKPAAAKVAAGESPASVGLGISGQPEATITPAPKRRKVEKPPANGTTPTAAMTAVFSNAKDSKSKTSASPRATPIPEQPAPKKQQRKALPTSNGQAKKRAGPAASPSVISSPVIGNFTDSAKPPRASPAPSVSGRPASARARQNSTTSNVDKPRPLPATATKPNGVIPAPLEIPPNNNGRRPSETPKITQMEPPSATAKVDPSRPHSERAPTPFSAMTAGPKKDGPAKPAEDDARKDPTPAATPTTTVQQVTTTKSGRASKPSTPAIGSFPEGPPNNNGRARPARNSEAPILPKRSHKKGASQAHAAAMQKLQQQKSNGGVGGDASNNVTEDDMDDPDEPRYCYCNRVSFGEMVGCDGGECKREWFHLECVGLRNAPPKNMKWFCDDCKKLVNNVAKKVNGR